MKTIFAILFSLFSFILVHAQTAPVEPIEPVAPENPKTPCEDCDEKDDTTFLSFGKVKVIIFEEKEDDVKISISENGDTTIILGKEKKKKFDGTWDGLSINANGALTYDNKFTLPEEMRFIELDYAKSISAALNFAELDFGFGKNQYFGITTGLGIQWNRYGIKNTYEIKYNEDEIYGDSSAAGRNYSKNVLKATYLTMPLLMEVHIGKKRSNMFTLAFGVIGGYKLGSRLKQEYEFEGRDYEFKTKGHYHFNPFQAYGTVRIGYGDVSLFANYGLTRIFEEGRGPQLYPIQFGLHFNVN